ncbi:MAG TPA: molybdate ABC transporter substrate-binding protein [Pirellulales bacterium]|jgi:molybdenum ABC transporter molybdate-binding protein
MATTHWASDWNVGIRVWIERRGAGVLGEGRADLLSAIGRRRSITKAAKATGLSYRRAWSMVQEMNSAAGEPLVAAAVGGIKGGGAELTERGQLALAVYRQVQQAMLASAADALQRVVNTDAAAVPCIHVAAAISLQEVVGQVLAEYALKQPAIRVRAIFGASNELADHVAAGASCDLFISAEREEIDRLESAGWSNATLRRTVATNGLAAIGLSRHAAICKPVDLLSPVVKKIAIAEPACPLGRYSKSFLQAAGIYDALLPKVLPVDNSRAVGAAVLSGAADIGIAFTSDAARLDECQMLFRVPAKQATAKYVAAIAARGKQTEEALALLDFLKSPAANRCFRRCGFRSGNQVD